MPPPLSNIVIPWVFHHELNYFKKMLNFLETIFFKENIFVKEYEKYFGIFLNILFEIESSK